ncbi:MAG: hypothetical protein K2H35_08490, partial [Muribaculaceae bacterium]|nr:hypothetical protein [Muribaculaceae bacterium]
LADNTAVISFQNRLTNTTENINSRATVAGQLLSVSFYNLLKPFISSGAILPGDEFTVTLKGLLSEAGQPAEGATPDGTTTFKFLCGSIPTVANQEYCPDPFLSYWPKGTPEGIIRITFDKKLGQSPNTVATLSWGNQEGELGEYYVEEIPAVINENVLTVDLTGKLRTPATMTPLYPQASYPNIGIEISGVVDEHGVPVGSTGEGTVGSYGFYPKYVVLDRTSIAAEFEPASGADLDLAKNLNVWISGIKNFTFDGFNIQYTDKNTGLSASVVVPMADVKVTPDSDDSAEYDFAMPEAVISNAARAIVTLNNLVTTDGYNHDNDVRAVYGGFVVTYADPANGTEMAMLTEGTKINIESNISEKYPEMYIEYEIINLNPEEGEDAIVKSTSWMTRQEDGTYQAEVYGNYKLMYGKEYKVSFTAWETEMIKNYSPEETLGNDFIIWKGLTPPYIYSDITLTGVTPENEASLDADQNTITITFDGIVNLGQTTGYNGLQTGIVMGSGAGLIPFAAVTPVDPVDVDGTTYSSAWELKFSEGYSANQTTPILISVKAFDEEGRLVKGSEGSDEETYFLFTFYPAGMFKDIEISFGEEPLSEVSEITVSFSAGINVSYDFPYSDVKVLDMDRNEVAVMADYIMDEDPNNEFAVITKGTIVLDKAISTEGNYVLVIPRGFFNLGTEFNTFKNNDVFQTFTVASGVYTVTPAAGTVTTLYDVTVTYHIDGEIKISESAGQPTWSKAGIDTPLDFENTTVDMNNLVLTFTNPITEAGTYTISIPEGYVLFADGSAAPAIEVAYTIEEVQDVDMPITTCVPAEGDVEMLPGTITIFFDNYESVNPGSGIATLTIDGGEPINLPAADIDWDDFENFNKILQPLDKEYTDKGTYVIDFPDGYFSLGEDFLSSPAFSLTYQIGNGSAVEIIDMQANEYTVYTLNGVRVLDRADRAAFKALAPGLYIVNGIKMIIK